MSLVVVATIKPLPQHRDEATEALKALVSAAHSESGVERFALLDGDDELLIIEKWADQASLDAHATAPLSAHARDLLATKLREPPTHKYLVPIPTGDPRLGQL